MSRITLVRLPAELLCHILAFLGDDATYDLVRVRRTCKALKALIDNSKMLQYIIDLCYFRMIHVGTHDTDVPLATHREQLRQREDAWQRFGYKQKCTLQPQRVSESTIHVVGGVYGSIREDRIHFARLPSASDADDEHSWSHPIDVVHLLDFTFCPEQDLFVLVTSSPDDERFLFHIHLRSLMTNGIHPNVAQSVLWALDTDNGHIEIRRSTRTHPEKLQINRNYISLQFRDFDVDRVYVQLWDWKCIEGYRFVLAFEDRIIDHSFIAEEKLLICTTRLMKIYSITDTLKPPQCTARLLFPDLIPDGWRYQETSTSINPSPGSAFPKFPLQPSCFFHPSLDDQLVVFHISIVDATERNSRQNFFFFARLSAILQLESSFAQRMDQATWHDPRAMSSLVWSEWGPQHTTWFDGDYLNWRQSLYGFRTVGLTNRSCWPSEPRRLCIRDFNPHDTCNDADDVTRRHGRLIQDTGRDTHYYPFTVPVGSALPYREIVSEEPFDSVSEMIMDESRILLLERRAGRLEKVDVLMF